MIRWCSYCQRFLGEQAPYDDPQFTHGICEACDAKLERDEPVHATTLPARTLVQQLIESAGAGDEAACQRAILDARALGVEGSSLLLGMLQPALYQAGREWQAGRMSVAAEHRLSAWCERAFSSLPVQPRSPPLDLLIFQTPGNTHTLGPRFAARVLASRGLSTEALVPELPLVEMVAQVRALRPRIVGFSCALPSSVTVAQETVARMREALEPEQRCRYVLSGIAFRQSAGGSPVGIEPGIEIVTELAQLRV